MLILVYIVYSKLDVLQGMCSLALSRSVCVLADVDARDLVLVSFLVTALIEVPFFFDFRMFMQDFVQSLMSTQLPALMNASFCLWHPAKHA